MLREGRRGVEEEDVLEDGVVLEDSEHWDCLFFFLVSHGRGRERERGIGGDQENAVGGVLLLSGVEWRRALGGFLN